MEILVATVISIISPYLAKGAEEFAKSAGKAAFDGTKALVTRLSKWWNKDPIANAAATSFKDDPEHYEKNTRLRFPCVSGDFVEWVYSCFEFCSAHSHANSLRNIRPGVYLYRSISWRHPLS